jgi:hypothetical protein
MNTMRLFLLIPLVALALACGDGDDPEVPPEQGPDATAILNRSAAAVDKLTSFHFRLTHENGTTPMPLNLQLVSAEGDVAVPDRLQAEVRARAASVSVNLDVIGIADDTWVTNPFSRRWQELPGANINQIADPTRLVTTLLANLKEPAIAGQNEIDGTKSFKITGRIDSGVIEEALSAAEPGLPVSVELWIGIVDSLPRRARLTGRLAAPEPEDIVRQVDISRFNARVDIQPPP